MTLTPELCAELGIDMPKPWEPPAPETVRMTRPEITHEEVLRTLAAAGGNLSEAARRLGITRDAIYRLLKRHGRKG